MTDTIDRRLRTLEAQVPRWKEPWRRGFQHHYQSMEPTTPDASAFFAPHTAARTPILCPLHLERPMQARAVYYLVKHTGEGARCRVAVALYRARAPVRATKGEMVAAPLGGVRFQLARVIGQSDVAATGDPTLQRIALSPEAADAEIDPELPHYLAFMFHDATVTMYAPVSANYGTPAIVSSTQAAAYADWPEELSADLALRARMPYFVVRSAMGVVLYGHPEEI